MSLNDPAMFIRDQTTGGRITKVVARKDGSYRYQMEEGHSYTFSATQFEQLGELCGRLGFQLRFAKGVFDV